MSTEPHPIPVDQWVAEPAPSEESERTKDGGGWTSWNSWSPELEFCEFAAALVRLVRPALVVETGIGQGYLTRRVLPALSGRYLGFETDDDLRARLRELDVWSEVAQLATEPEASGDVLAACDLAILDSAPDTRWRELNRWLEHGSPGAYLLIHDARPDHPIVDSGFRHLAAFLRERGGVFLGNPRGSWLYRKPLARNPSTR